MKFSFFHLLFIAMIVVAIYTIHNYQVTMAPIWTVTAAQQATIDLQQRQQDAIVDAQAHAERAQLFTGILQGVGSGLVLLLFGFGGVYMWKVYDQRRESWARPVDGQYALQQFNQAGQIWTVDPNKSVFGVIGQDKRTGMITTDATLISADRQLAYATTVQTTRTASAVTSGDGFRYASTGKFLAGAYDKTQSVDVPQLEEQELPTNWKALTVQDAFAQSDGNRWVMGQSPATGELFELNPKEAAHFGIVGATGTGKTAYTALLLMAYAMRNKYRVVILDGKGGSDWRQYQSLVEYASLDYTNVGGIVGQMVSEYEKRQAILNQYGVNSIWELPSGVTKPRPTLFIVDEFGATMDSLKAASKTAYKSVELDLGNLLRLSRGAGLYVVLCDQNPSKWPGTVRANLPVNLCYRLGGGIGNAVQEYNLDKLERVGQFQVSNTIYNAFPTYLAIDELLPDGSYKKPLALLTVDSSVTGYGKEGGDTGQNTTPKTITDEPVTAPVTGSYTRVTGAVTDPDQTVTAPVTTVMAGPPVTAKDKDKIRNIYAMTQSKSETCRLVWGGKNGQRMAWLNEILQDGTVQQ